MSAPFDMESRKKWRRELGAPTVEELKLGCLQRIADATETMAKDHDRIVRERDDARADRDFWQAEADRLARRLSAAQGQRTRLKRKLAALVAQQGERRDD